jgi:TolB protein
MPASWVSNEPAGPITSAVMTKYTLPLGLSLLALAGCAGDGGGTKDRVAEWNLPAPRTQPATQPTKEPLVDVVQLTRGFARAGEAYFSNDGRWIIFQASPNKVDEPYQMYVAALHWEGDRLAGIAGEPVRISPDNSRNTCGYFSPDGNSIIFGSTAGKEKADAPVGGYQRQGRDYRWDFSPGMEIFRADDWKSQMGTAKQLNLARRALTDNDVYDAEGSFSPDGKWIVFTRGAGPDADLYVMRSDGSGKPLQITSAKGYDGGPFFSPEGKRLVYRSDRQGNDLLQVFTCDLTFDEKGDITGFANERQLTNDANVNWAPTWHPAGKHIVFTTSTHGHHNYELYVMRDDGSARTRLTVNPGADVLPVFSPDGRWLMWTSKRMGETTSQVFAARVAKNP